jgi:AcrR family transcriptional regulator
VREERRQQIRSSALRLFAENGLAATKMSDIAADVGISQGLFYHYYPSKEALFTELIEHAFTTLNTAARGLEQLALPPAEKVILAVKELLRGLEEHADTGPTYLLIAQATASAATPEAAKAIIQRENRTPYDVMARIFRAGQAEGTIKPFDPDQLALVFWTSMTGLAIYKAAHGAEFRAPEADILLNLFLTRESISAPDQAAVTP